MERNIFFEPYVGNDYHNGGIFGKRIMVLGESHYCDENCTDCGKLSSHRKCANFTKNVVNDYLDQRKERKSWMNTLVKFERSLVGHTTNWAERKDIWHSLLFFNYLQVAMDTPRKAGTKEQYDYACKVFYDVIDKYKPQYIIVWGDRLWNSLPGDSRWQWSEPIVIEGYKVQAGSYRLSNGDTSKIIVVYHPSSGYSWKWWYKAIKDFLQ